MESFDKPLVDGEGNTVGTVHIEADASAQFPLRLYKEYLLSDVDISYKIQEQYEQGEEISPQVILTIAAGNTMYGQLGAYPLTYTATEADLPVSASPSPGNTNTVLKVTGIVAKTVLVVLGIGVVACLGIRQFNLNRQRKRLVARRRAYRRYNGNRFR